MPMFISQEVFTGAQIAENGVPRLHEHLFAQALSGPLAHLKDGRVYVIQIHPRNPQQIDGQPGHFRIQVEIRWLLGNPDQAQIGEIVYGPLLWADDKGEDVERFEATRNGKVFHPHVNGWVRVNAPPA